MVRNAQASEVISPRKIPVWENCSDIFTKCLTGEAFFRNRARVRGLPYTAAPPVVVPRAHRAPGEKS